MNEIEIEQPQIIPILDDPMRDYWICFSDPPFFMGTNSSRFEDIETWIHEFSEMELIVLLRDLGHNMPYLRFIDPLRRFRNVALSHLVTSLHTRSFVNENERTPDEYARETIDKFALCNKWRLDE